MNTFKLILISGLLILGGYIFGNAYASDLVQSERDCADILEQWANDPDSVPRHLVDACKERMAASTAPVDADAPTVAPMAGGQQAADPCAGPNAAASVNCWGPWSALAPAAAGDAPPGDLLPVDEFDVRPELASQFDPVIAACVPGAPCGFATVVNGITGQGPVDDTIIVPFDLAADGSQFTVAPGQAGQIASVEGMTPVFSNRADGFENMRSNGADGDLRSRLIARVMRDANGNIVTAADAWAHGDAGVGTAQSGFFAWGTSMVQADLNALNSGSVAAVFSGPMSVDNATNATITLNFGVNPSWTGGWTNPDYAFDAGGALIGVDLISDPNQFSPNVGADSFVQGALLGDLANQSIAHAIDVDLAGVGRIRDVGLLQGE